MNNSKTILQEIQDRLFTIGSSLACDPEKEPKMKIPDLKEEDITLLEKEIDKMNEDLAANEIFYSSRRSSYRFTFAYCPLCLPPCRTLLCKT